MTEANSLSLIGKVPPFTRLTPSGIRLLATWSGLFTVTPLRVNLVIVLPAQLLFQDLLKHFKGLCAGYKHAVDQKGWCSPHTQGLHR